MDVTMHKMFLVACLIFLPIFASADTCLGPSVSAETYTTSEVTVSTETVFIAQFNLTCTNGLQNVSLYADVAGKMIPAVKTSKANEYQINITDEYNSFQSGVYEVKFYDEESFSALKEAKRNNEDTSSVTPLFSIYINHSKMENLDLLDRDPNNINIHTRIEFTTEG